MPIRAMPQPLCSVQYHAVPQQLTAIPARAFASRHVHMLGCCFPSLHYASLHVAPAACFCSCLCLCVATAVLHWPVLCLCSSQPVLAKPLRLMGSLSFPSAVLSDELHFFTAAALSKLTFPRPSLALHSMLVTRLPILFRCPANYLVTSPLR